MLSFRNLSLRRKQTLIIMLTSGIVLLLACAAFVTYDTVTFRRELVKSVSVLAEAVGNNCVAAIDFNDPKTAGETLAALRANDNVVSACLYSRDGQAFAVYQRIGPTPFVPPKVRGVGEEFGRGQLSLFRPVKQRDEVVGTMFVSSDLKALSARLMRYLGIVGLVFLASGLVALALSNQLQRLVSDPILHLARVARSVAVDKDYSVRATKRSEDELGQLIDGFNEMLAQIQERDGALQTARDQLEHRVEERTGELASSVALLNATLQASVDGILGVDLKGNFTTYNKQFARLWGYSEEVLGRRNLEELTAIAVKQLKNPELLVMRIGQLQLSPEHERFDTFQFLDQRTVECVSRPQYIGDKCVGRVITFRDITERKLRQDELERTHRELLETSREAGMAEIATNVLHNIGNVLNSVNVSASLVVDSVRRSKVSSLAKVVALLGEHANGLGAFFTSDPRAKQLPGYLSQLSEHFLEDQRATIKELDSLRGNIEHIKEIVAMQQRYAKVSGIKELINLNDLVEDSLRINAGTLNHHQVEVVRELENLPPMNVEKHQILQILVNLVRNAKHACQDSNRAGRRLTVRVLKDAERVKISVIDNGIGIPAENLARIFSHGFTTRKDGHGFGLHSGALAAREMGGSLTVQSDGVGQGAAFTLELPLREAAAPS